MEEKQIVELLEDKLSWDGWCGIMGIEEAAAEIANLYTEERGKPTGWFVLVEKLGDKWVAVKCVNPDHDDEIPEEWAVCLPIPEPDSIPEFLGW